MDNVELVIKIVSVSLVPIVGYFGVQVINMMKKLERVESDFDHLKGNYAQAFNAITNEMLEIRNDIKELLRRSYKDEGRHERAE